MTRQWQLIKRALTLVLSLILCFGVLSCSDRTVTPIKLGGSDQPSKPLVGRLYEVAPPSAIQELSPFLEAYQPQITILSPRNGQVLEEDSVAVRLQVRDFPLYKNERFELGPHLHVILDNQPYQAVYDLDEPLVFSNLEPGTHTLRVFASRPWHESFKNEGAYAQVTFHLFTQTPDNYPQANAPLLTYSRPKGTYGAEPIMLDFYLKNAPLHFIAQEDPKDEIVDWRIRCTINGESFVFDSWQPIYLKGWKPGKNWVKLEFLDENGKVVNNAFNTTVRLITYEPGGQDTLSKLMRGELTATEVRSIVDPDYVPPEEAPASPEPSSGPESIPSPILTPSPIPAPTQPPAIERPQPEVSPSEAPILRTPSGIEPAPEELAPTPPTQAVEPEASPPTQESSEPAMPEAEELEKESSEFPQPQAESSTPSSEQKPGRFFNRFLQQRRSAPTPLPDAAPPTLPEVLEEPDLEAIQEELQPEPSEVKSPETIESSPVEAQPETDLFKEEREPESSESVAPVAPPSSQPVEQPGGFLNRFRRRPAIAPPSGVREQPSSLPEVLQVPTEPESVPLEPLQPEEATPEAMKPTEAGELEQPEAVPSDVRSPEPLSPATSLP